MALLSASLAVPLFAQTKTADPFFSETIEVRIINVDAIVTGKDGKPVRGLSKDDFEVFENGKRQEITNFAEMTAAASDLTGAAPAAAPAPAPALHPAEAPQDIRPRDVVVFIDNASLRPFNRNKVVEVMTNFVRQVVRPGDGIMVVSWNPPLHVPVPLSGDVNAAIAGLEKIKGESAIGTNSETERKLAERAINDLPTDFAMVQRIPPIDLAIEQARLYAAKVMHEQRQKVEAIKSVMNSMRGVEGRKVFVIVTEALSDRAAQPIFEFVDQVKDRFANGQSYSYEREAKQYEEPSLTSIMSETANSTGVTFYPIDAAGLAGDMEGINAESLRGEYITPTIKHFGRRDLHLQTMRDIAAQTGGTALVASNNFKLALDTIANDLQSYYSIGYRATGAKQDTIRSIQVRLKNKRGLEIRTRQAFVERSTSSEMKDAVAANLFYPVAHNDLNIRIGAAGLTQPGPMEEHIVVPVEVHIPTSALTLIPDGAELRGRFSSFTAFLRKDGAVSEVKTNTHELRFPADSLKRRKEITLKLELMVDTKTEAVSVGVTDDVSHSTGFAALKLQ